MNDAVKFLRCSDVMMSKAGIQRQERRALWRGMANSAEERDKILTNLSNRLGLEDVQTGE